MATVGITIDGKKIDADSFDTAAAQVLAPETKIEMTVIAAAELQNSFKQLIGTFGTLAQKMKQVPVDLQSGKDAEAGKTVTELADRMDEFCHLTALSALFPDKYGTLKIDGKTVSEFFADFSGILSDFEKGLESSDTVMIGDLSEYEISPRLEAIVCALEALS
jgi:hypothetical protein